MKRLMFALAALLIAAGIFLASCSGKIASMPGSAADSKPSLEPSTLSIEVTDGVKHSISIDEIIGGGPSRDGIPPIDSPKFVSIKAASLYVEDRDFGLSVRFEDQDRFYPFSILLWHEVVNDTVNGQPVLVTYCPLCDSGIVFDPSPAGNRVDFGTSGKLYNSNLLMYDRATESLWSQILGEAVLGPLTGTRLPVIPSDQMQFGKWKAQNPLGQVLSLDTGTERPYGTNPYETHSQVGWVDFPLSNHDDRLHPKRYVQGLVIGGQAKAYLPAAVQTAKTVKDRVGGKDFLIRYEEEPGVVRVYEKGAHKKAVRVEPISSYWYCWAAVHPGSGLFQ